MVCARESTGAVTEQTAIIATADITARLSTQAYTRLFAKNGGSTVDTAFRDLVIAETNSRIRSLTRAAFPDGLYEETDTIDPEVPVELTGGLTDPELYWTPDPLDFGALPVGDSATESVTPDAAEGPPSVTERV